MVPVCDQAWYFILFLKFLQVQLFLFFNGTYNLHNCCVELWSHPLLFVYWGMLFGRRTIDFISQLHMIFPIFSHGLMLALFTLWISFLFHWLLDFLMLLPHILWIESGLFQSGTRLWSSQVLYIILKIFVGSAISFFNGTFNLHICCVELWSHPLLLVYWGMLFGLRTIASAFLCV